MPQPAQICASWRFNGVRSGPWPPAQPHAQTAKCRRIQAVAHQHDMRRPALIIATDIQDGQPWRYSTAAEDASGMPTTGVGLQSKMIAISQLKTYNGSGPAQQRMARNGRIRTEHQQQRGARYQPQVYGQRQQHAQCGDMNDDQGDCQPPRRLQPPRTAPAMAYSSRKLPVVVG